MLVNAWKTGKMGRVTRTLATGRAGQREQHNGLMAWQMQKNDKKALESHEVEEGQSRLDDQPMATNRPIDPDRHIHRGQGADPSRCPSATNQCPSQSCTSTSPTPIIPAPVTIQAANESPFMMDGNPEEDCGGKSLSRLHYCGYTVTYFTSIYCTASSNASRFRCIHHHG